MLTPISIVACLVHSDKLQIARIATLMTACVYAASMVLTGNSMGMVNGKLEMVNFTRLRLVKFIPVSNTTLVVFILNFTATHAVTSTNRMEFANYIM